MVTVVRKINSMINSKQFWKKVYSFIFRSFSTILLLGFCFIILYPIIIKLSQSFKIEQDLYDPTVFIIPKNFTFANYATLFDRLKYFSTLLNTTGLCLVTSIFQTFSCAFVAYGLARFKFKGRNIVYLMYIIMLVIPPQAILLPLYIQFKSFDILSMVTFGLLKSASTSIINTPLPILLMSVTASGFKNGLFIYLLTQHFKNMPMILEEAAYIDGCGPYKTFKTIMLPSAIPIMLTIFLFSFVWQWNDYYYTAILMPNLQVFSTRVLEVGAKIVAYENDPYNMLRASILNNTAFIIQIIPLLIIFIFAQKYFVQGIERSGIVG